MATRLAAYRVVVFARKEIKRGRKVQTVESGWIAWNPDHTVEAGRLPGSGSFVWLGLQAAKNAAGAAFLDASVTQVQIRTNQDAKVCVINRGYKGVRSEYAKQALVRRLAA